MQRKPKILVLDVETKPALVYTFTGRKAYIGPDQIVKPDGIICWAAKWYGQSGTKFGAEWESKSFLTPLRDLIAEADAVVTFNGDGFDFRKIRGELVRRKLKPLPPVASIDLYKTVKGLGFFSGKLAYVSKLLKLGSKVKHHGFGLWVDVLDGDPTALRTMKRYNKKDVTLTEELYTALRPYIVKHPRLGPRGNCTACGSGHLQYRGVRRNLVTTYHRTECQDCGHWDIGPAVKEK